MAVTRKRKNIMNKLLIALTLMAALFTNIAFAEKISFQGGEYSGDLKDGVPHGEGEIVYPEGDGDEGLVEYEYDKAFVDKIVGSFLNGKLDGMATITWKNGMSFVGEYKDGTKNGKGILTLLSGNTYDGEWKNNLLHGQGTMDFLYWYKYEGNFSYGLMHGQGTMTWAKGDKYVGEFVGDVREGQGTMTYANGNKYVGGWKNGLMHGQGTLISKSFLPWSKATKHVGIWKDGKQIKADKEKSLAKVTAKKENKMKLQSETKCAKKAGKASNDFAAKKIYESCMAANK